jgi:hypothetical protein
MLYPLSYGSGAASDLHAALNTLSNRTPSIRRPFVDARCTELNLVLAHHGL